MNEDEDTARPLAEAIADMLNVFAPIIWPNRFGELPCGWDDARSIVDDLRLKADRFNGHGGPEFNVESIRRLLPELQRALGDHEEPPPDEAGVRALVDQLMDACGVRLS